MEKKNTLPFRKILELLREQRRRKEKQLNLLLCAARRGGQELGVASSIFWVSTLLPSGLLGGPAILTLKWAWPKAAPLHVSMFRPLGQFLNS